MSQPVNHLWVRLSIAFVIALLLGAVLPTILFEIGLRTGLVAPLPANEVFRPPAPLVAGEPLVFDSEAAFHAWLTSTGFDEVGPPPAYEVTFFAEYIVAEHTLLTVAALLSIGIGSILGVSISRSISRPLSDLVTATRAIRKRDLRYRAALQGTSEMQALAQAFNAMACSLERSETVRRNMMADVAHELRTPLSVLDGNLRAMLDGVFPITPDELGLLHEQTRHLTRLVNDLRELALAEAKQLALQFEEVAMDELIHETVAIFAPLAQEQRIELRTELSSPLALRADRNRLRQVLHNLLANAIRHTPAAGRVVVVGRPRGASIELAVHDSGAGLDREQLAAIFDRFQRGADGQRRDSGGGMGLGLAIVKAIVELHDGAISATSAGLGQGAVFTIQLPRKEG
ncbi:MAG: ATP-binding protein [Chloroflexales bacterium]|nr:ATP-binding protein [Chloroflexales bacterium]